MARLRGALPPGAQVVDEDALTNLLWRSLDDTRAIAFVPATAEHVRAAMARGPVYALPRAQRRLQRLGLRIRITPANEAVGLAEVVTGPECVVAADAWRPMALPPDASGLAFAAPSPAARGPVIVYLAHDAITPVTPRGWPPGSERGFHAVGYELDAAGDLARFDADRLGDQLPDAWYDTARFITRLEIWRVPDAPLTLDVEIDGPALASVVRAAPSASAPHAAVCASFGADQVPSVLGVLR
jgi:hypothetical protein